MRIDLIAASGQRRRSRRPPAADLTTGALPSWLTLTRASGATVQTGTATLTSGLAVNAARFGRLLDADPLGLLIECAATNAQMSSEDPTSADWAAGTAAAPTYPSGTAPNGSATTGCLWSVTNPQYSRFSTFGATTGVNRQFSMWTQGISGSPLWQAGAPTASYSLVGTWKRVSAVYVTAGSIYYFTPALTNTQSVRTWGHQVETRGYPGSYIPTTLGATASRSGERLTATGTLSSGGRVDFCFEMQPFGASSEYTDDGAAATLLYESSTYKVEWATATRVLTLTVGGVTNTCTLNTWTRGQTIKLRVSVGGGIATVVKQQVAAGAVNSLAITGSALGAWAPTSLDVLCASTGVQFSGVVTNLNPGVSAWAA